MVELRSTKRHKENFFFRIGATKRDEEAVRELGP
jgi:hypothetical protein